MSEYILSCESTADLTREHFESRGIRYVCPVYVIDGVEYREDFGELMPYEEFYQKISEGAEMRTSQVNISGYVEYFTQFLEQGKDIVHVCLSSGLTGAINSARNAAQILSERFPERKLYIVDSLCASSGYGLLMDDAADQRDAGLPAEELVKWIEDNRLLVNHWFFSTDLSTYVRGGRISKAAAVFGGVLEICPLLNMDAAGCLTPREKVRTKKKVIREIVKKMEQHAENGHDYAGKCYISYSGSALEDAEQVAALIEEAFPALQGKVELNWVGKQIGSHTGPGTVALFFRGTERE